MKKNMKNTLYQIVLLSTLVFMMWFLNSCGKDAYLEKRSGPWKVTKAEIAYYNSYKSEPDSVKTFESDTLGYFNFYHGTPSNVYVLINYPSAFLIKDYDATYEVHEENYDILVISNLVGANWVERRFAVDHPKRKKQQWTIVSDNHAGNAVRETIFVEKE